MSVKCIGFALLAVAVPGEGSLPAIGTMSSEERFRVELDQLYILHVTQPFDTQCVEVAVNRVVKCLQGCEDEEFIWCFPIGCETHILPPGTYDIYIPDQDAYPVNEGEILVNMLLEPIDNNVLRALELNCK